MWPTIIINYLFIYRQRSPNKFITKAKIRKYKYLLIHYNHKTQLQAINQAKYFSLNKSSSDKLTPESERKWLFTHSPRAIEFLIPFLPRSTRHPAVAIRRAFQLEIQTGSSGRWKGKKTGENREHVRVRRQSPRRDDGDAHKFERGARRRLSPRSAPRCAQVVARAFCRIDDSEAALPNFPGKYSRAVAPLTAMGSVKGTRMRAEWVVWSSLVWFVVVLLT